MGERHTAIDSSRRISAPVVRVVATTEAPPERVLEAARDFSTLRAQLWPDVHLEHLDIHEVGDTFADVTEGTRSRSGSSGNVCATTGRSPDR